MKTLYLLRHAKSSWDKPSLSDLQRPLLPEGIARTEKLCRFMREQNIRPGIILCSPAVRTHETAKLIATATGYPSGDIHIKDPIYFGTAEQIWDLLFEIPESIESAMIVGHNPVLTWMANSLLGHPIDNLPTTGLAAFRFHTDQWTQLFLAAKETLFLTYPKYLP
jgi:phosphohistidine phosphatase